MILSLAFLGLTSEVLLSDCYCAWIVLAWLGLTYRNLRVRMPEISGEFNQDTLSQIVCIFHSAKVSKGGITDGGSERRLNCFLSQIGSPFYTKSLAYISKIPIG